MFDGAIVKGMNSRTFEHIEISKMQLESLLIWTMFDCLVCGVLQIASPF